jgi:N-methylhydantoinase B
MPDSGGPGEYRGGVAASLAVMPYSSTIPMTTNLAAGGKGVSQNTGLSGGYPGNTGYEAIVRGSHVADLLAGGKLPISVDELGGQLEVQPCYVETTLAPDDVLIMHWQSGGGYGDPLLRDPEAVVSDVVAGKVSVKAALDVYGVSLGHEGAVDVTATAEQHTRLRGERQARSTVPDGFTPALLDTATARRLNGTLVSADADGGTHVACGNCGQLLGTPGSGHPLALARYDGPATDAGPQIMIDPSFYTDADVVFRQYCCPSCWTAIDTTVRPVDGPDFVTDPNRFSQTLPTVADAESEVHA